MLNYWGWKLKTAFQKQIIRFEDRFNLYPYWKWLVDQDVPVDRDSFPLQDALVNILVFFQPGSERIEQTIESLQNQVHQRWRLVPVIEDFQNNSSARMPTRDQRIIGGGTSENSLETFRRLAALDGEYFLCMAAGDTLSEDFLSKAIDILDRNQRSGGMYFDEDVILKGETRSKPCFWPDWSPALLYSTPYLAHTVWRMDLFRSNPLPADLQPLNAIWYDLMFFCAEQSAIIGHIPQPGYHQSGFTRRTNAGDFCASLSRHIQRTAPGKNSTVELQEGNIHIRWQQTDKIVSIIIPTHDHRAYLERSLDSLFRITRNQNFEVILVDNASSDPSTLAYYGQLSQNRSVRLLQGGPDFNFSRFNNLGASQAKGGLLLFLNDDVKIIDPNWLDELAGWASLAGVGIVGGRLLYPDRTIQHAGVIIGMEGHASHVFNGKKAGYSGPFGSVDWYRNYMAVTGACMMVPRQVFQQSGGFSEKYHLVFSDIELGLRLNSMGYRVVYNPYARLVHYEGRSRARFMPADDLRTAFADLKDQVESGDPYYNPNLSYAVRIPSLRRRGEESPISRLEHIMQIIQLHAD